MKKREHVDWLVVHERGAFECRRCGKIETFPSPILINQYLALANRFTEEHKDCEQISKS